jgi:hypothetical protein
MNGLRRARSAHPLSQSADNDNIPMSKSQQRFHLAGVLLLLAGWTLPSASAQSGSTIYLPLVARGFGAPVLKWQRGGCYSSWCETAWYSSAAVADLEGDGSKEVIGAAYSVMVLDGASGALERRLGNTGNRQWPSLVVADLEPNGDLEIVSAHSGGWLYVYDHLGSLVWSRQPTPGSELRSLAVANIDAAPDLEIIVAATRSDDQWFVYEHDGNVRPGWPRFSGDGNAVGYAAGAYNENVAAGNVDGDSALEIIGPNDTHYTAAFNDDGSPLPASAIYNNISNPPGPRVWARVGVHVDHAVDLRGYAFCGSEHRPNFAHSAPTIADVNGDGVREIIIVGNVYNCGTNPYTNLYEMPFIFRGDRTRWSGNGFDWTAIPAPAGAAAPLSEDYNLIENSMPNPVVADLDNDGVKEILYASYDGRVHAYWLDKTEHGQWPFEVHNPAEGFYRFASEPVVVDLDNDGKAEVIFASWPQKGGNRVGKLHIVSSSGLAIHEVALPPAFSGNYNGALAAPTVANIDSDADYEVVLNTVNAGLVAYDLPGSANARILWGTGRGDYGRAGSK